MCRSEQALHTKHPKLQMSMPASQDFVRMSSGARRATGVMGVVAIGLGMRDARMGLVSGLEQQDFLLAY